MNSSNPVTSTRGLFRQEVVPRAHETYGVPMRWQVARPALLALVLIGMVVAGATVVLQLEYAEKISATGLVRSLTAPVVLRSPVDGVVSRVEHTSGDVIAQHSLLLAIDRQLRGADGVSDQALKLRHLEQSDLAARREQEAAERHLAAQMQGLRTQRDHLQAQIGAAQQTLQLRSERLELEHDVYRRIQTLMQRGWGSQQEAGRARAAWLEASALQAQQQANLQALRGRAAALDTQLQALHHQQLLGLRQHEARLQALAAQGDELRQAREVTLAAPVGGVITDHTVHVGMPVTAQSRLLTISSTDDSDHEIDLLIPSAGAGRIRSGMPVRLRYSGYPHQTFGAGKGYVSQVSDAPRVDAGQSWFHASVAITRLPDGIDQVPDGMVVEADILLQSRSLGAWLLDPLRRSFARL